MRRRGVAGVLVAALLAGLWWARGDAPPRPDPVATPAAKARKVTRFAPEPVPSASPDGDVLLQAARGELGEDYQGRVCALCASGRLAGAPCEAAACAPDEELPAHGRLVVDVVDEGGRPEDRARIHIGGCAFTPAGERGMFLVEAPATCRVSATRRDGALFARAPEVVVEVPAHGEPYVQLELSSVRTGGLGVSIHPVDEGIRVVAVLPGTPAEELGLEPGDVILEVNGLDTRGIDARAFIEEMTGPEGTEVDFVVQLGDDPEATEALSIVRRFLDKSS